MKPSHLISLLTLSLATVCGYAQNNVEEDKPEKKSIKEHHFDGRGSFKYTYENTIPIPMPDSIFAVGGLTGNKIIINKGAVFSGKPNYIVYFDYKDAEKLLEQQVNKEDFDENKIFLIKAKSPNYAEILTENSTSFVEHLNALGSAEPKKCPHGDHPAHQ